MNIFYKTKTGRKSFFYRGRIYFLFALLLFSSLSEGANGEEDLDLEFLALYVGVQYDYKLPFGYEEKQLTFEGTYKRYTALQHLSAQRIIRFTPRRVGVATLNIKDGQGNILQRVSLKVRKTDLQETANEIREALSTIDGISVKIKNNRVVVDGEILLVRDMKRIHTVVTEYKGRATSWVSLSPVAQKKIAQFIEKEINDPNISVRATNNVFILEGRVDSEGRKLQAEQVAKLHIPDYIVDLAVSQNKIKEWNRTPLLNRIQVVEKKKDERKKLIQLVVHYVELNKDFAKNFRFSWQPQIADGTQFTFLSSSSGVGQIGGMISGTINNFLPKLNWAKNFGFARVIHSANVTTEEGKAASISANKQIPFVGALGPNGEQGVSFANAGLRMTLTPQVTGPQKDSVQLSGINFTLTSVVGKPISGQAPTTSSKSISTNIYVQNGRSAAIGGVISNIFVSDYNKEPEGQSKSPLLSFLASKSFTRSQNQFVIFITPYIRTNASVGVEKTKRKFNISSGS